jgi:hypothetical protein
MFPTRCALQKVGHKVIGTGDVYVVVGYQTMVDALSYINTSKSRELRVKCRFLCPR